MNIRRHFFKWLFNKKQHKVDLKSIKSILIIRQDRLGDLILMLPFIFGLKKKFPNSRVVILLSEANKSLKHHLEGIECKITSKSILKNIKVFLDLRNSKFDLYIDPLYSTRERAYRKIKWVSPKQVIGFCKKKKYGLSSEEFKFLDECIKLDENKSIFINNYLLYKKFIDDITLQEYKDFFKGFSLPKKSLEKIKSFKSSQSIITLNVQGSDSHRTMTPIMILEVVNFLESILPKDFNILITALPDYLKEITQVYPELYKNSYFNDDIDDVIALIQYSDLVLTMDTAIAHISSILNRPTIGLYTEYRHTQKLFLPFSDFSDVVYIHRYDTEDIGQINILKSKIKNSISTFFETRSNSHAQKTL